MSTCKDWFNMMRPVLYAVAINCDQYAFAYKQAAGMIKDCTVKATTAVSVLAMLPRGGKCGVEGG